MVKPEKKIFFGAKQKWIGYVKATKNILLQLIATVWAHGLKQLFVTCVCVDPNFVKKKN